MEAEIEVNLGKKLPRELSELLASAPSVIYPDNRQQLVEMSLGGKGADYFEVTYDIPGMGEMVVGTVTRCRNGLAVNYTDAYMRRRDPESMVIADDGPTDKIRFQQRFGSTFESLRSEILRWLGSQDLVVLAFKAGGAVRGYDALLVAPADSAFFALALADLQGMIAPADIPDDFSPRAVI